MRYNPWGHLASRPDLHLVWADLRGLLGTVGGATITLATRLLQTERRCTLAHELVHVERGTPGDDWCAREERHVDAIAARRLIGLEQLVDAVLWSVHEAEIADELWVDAATLRARLSSLSATERDVVERRLAEAGATWP